MSRRMKQRDEGEMRGANLARIDDGSWRMPTSATERRTDSTRTSRHVRFVPGRDSCTATRARLFDHLVGASKQGWRHGDTERLRGLQVNDQFKFNWLLNR